ncbi:hypothetical protein C8Q72DRAFT_881448 [Fomitopsis betulina]|nr:hypothetical protein C8Q72DRAFT_881448 [Fomitopsis betulina]
MNSSQLSQAANGANDGKPSVEEPPEQLLAEHRPPVHVTSRKAAQKAWATYIPKSQDSPNQPSTKVKKSSAPSSAAGTRMSVEETQKETKEKRKRAESVVKQAGKGLVDMKGTASSERREPKKAKTGAQPKKRYAAAIISDSDDDSRVGLMLPIAPQQRVSQKGHGKFKSCAATPQDIEDALNDSGEERRDDDSQQDDDGEEPEPRGGCDDLESEQKPNHYHQVMHNIFKTVLFSANHNVLNSLLRALDATGENGTGIDWAGIPDE